MTHYPLCLLSAVYCNVTLPKQSTAVNILPFGFLCFKRVTLHVSGRPRTASSVPHGRGPQCLIEEVAADFSIYSVSVAEVNP